MSHVGIGDGFAIYREAIEKSLAEINELPTGNLLFGQAWRLVKSKMPEHGLGFVFLPRL